MGLIFGLSAQPTLPELMGGWMELQDIAGHFTAYGVLALLGGWALEGTGVRHAGRWAFLLALLYGLSDEFHQRFVPGRHPDLLDIATDAAGAAIAPWLAARWRLRFPCVDYLSREA
jgi:VanZ family protein